MKFRADLLALAFVVTLTPSLANINAGWYSLKPKDCGFSVEMPSQPYFMSKWITDEGVRYPAYKYIVVKGNMFYEISFADMNVAIPSNQVDQLLLNIIDGMSKSSKSAVLNNEKVTVQGRPGRIFTLQDQQNNYTAAMTCWDGRRSFVISLKAPIQEFKGDAVKTYFKTFKLTSK